MKKVAKALAWARPACLLASMSVAGLLVSTDVVWAQVEGAAISTRMLVTTDRVIPAKRDRWIELQQNGVIPALKRAGVAERTVYEKVIGESTEFVIVRPLPSFAEFDGPGPIESALGAARAALLEQQLHNCTDSIAQRVVNQRDDFFLDPAGAEAVFVSRYRAMPGRNADYMNFVRTEMMPVMRQAQEDGTFAGLSVWISAQGGEANLITLNMFYDDFAPLDGPPPIAKTLGPQGTHEFLVKGAGPIQPIEQLVLRRVDSLSY